MISLSRFSFGKFSLAKSLFAITLAAVMFRASVWQWDRYKYKQALVASYQANSIEHALDFPAEQLGTTTAPAPKPDEEVLKPVLHRKVHIKGRIDFSKQMIVTNQRSADGPGHHLFAPLHIAGSDRIVLLSRGFVPFDDRTPETWQKYNFDPEVEIDAVVQESVHTSAFGPKNPEPTAEQPFVFTWYYEEVDNMAKQIPGNVVTSVYLDKLGGPPQGKYPEQAISFRVPPSTHFGYTIEWALLGMLTLVLGVVLQLFRFGTQQVPYQEKLH